MKFKANICKKEKNNIKVGIITIISRNYGNRLQNFALQKVLENRNIQVRTIPMHNYAANKNRIKYILKKILRKNVVWEEFDLKIKFASKECSRLNIKKYNFFIAGSDQIWNPYFNFNSKREFLYFSKGEQKIAYAASIGVDELPEEYYKKYSDLMKDIKHISVREESAVYLVKKITGKEVPVVLDPVMLLEKNDWINFIKRKKWMLNEKYIVKYFLGGCKKEYEDYINYVKNTRNCKVIDILNNIDKKTENIGPIEFVSIISGAVMVCTDSFHATVFSIIFSIPFITFGRQSEEGYGDMMPRLVSLLNKFKLSERLIIDKKQLLSKNWLECNFLETQKILSSEREFSLQFLNQALEN